MDICPNDLIALAHRLADAARPIARHYFRQTNDLSLKADLTPVTAADREIESAWRDIIMRERPRDGIWGEEFGQHQPDADYQWIVDPIDGTHAFSLGRTSFGCLIALHHVTHGFILGVCDQPVTDERWMGARGLPTYYNGTELPYREPHDPLAPLRVAITNPTRFALPLQRCHDRLQRDGNTVMVYGGNCLNFAAIASGWLDLSFENKQSIYDVAAFVPILQGVGAVITQPDGKPIALDMADGVIASANPDIQEHYILLAGA